jgi:two-component system, LytTR family, sensor kinase
MKIAVDKKRVKLYLWIALSYTALWIFTDVINNPDTLLPRAWNYIWLNSFVLFFNYILFEYTLPFIKHSWKRMLTAPVLLFAHVMINTFGLYAWRMIGIKAHVYIELTAYPELYIGVQNVAGIGIFSFFFFGIIKHLYDFRKLKQAAQQLTIEKQAAELNFLKSQTNPHFLFNTLNNIYSLARDKSDLAPESILRLSKILRYILYETGGEYIAIEQEIKIIDDYISLEKLRYDDSLRININHDIEDMKQSLPPLLLMPLIENAFKHGASETRHNPFVDIHLSVKNRNLKLTVINSIEASPESNIKENIGLSNLKRQLELLYKDYDLSLSKDESGFKAILKINLASHV